MEGRTQHFYMPFKNVTAYVSGDGFIAVSDLVLLLEMNEEDVRNQFEKTQLASRHANKFWVNRIPPLLKSWNWASDWIQQAAQQFNLKTNQPEDTTAAAASTVIVEIPSSLSLPSPPPPPPPSTPEVLPPVYSQPERKNSMDSNDKDEENEVQEVRTARKRYLDEEEEEEEEEDPIERKKANNLRSSEKWWVMVGDPWKNTEWPCQGSYEKVVAFDVARILDIPWVIFNGHCQAVGITWPSSRNSKPFIRMTEFQSILKHLKWDTPKRRLAMEQFSGKHRTETAQGLDYLTRPRKFFRIPAPVSAPDPVPVPASAWMQQMEYYLNPASVKHFMEKSTEWKTIQDAVIAEDMKKLEDLYRATIKK